jgi:transcriptional regulator with XRE-family HTH domain
VDTDQFYADVGKRISARRKAAGLTQEALAAAMGMSRPALANIERGGQRLALHVALKLARVLRLEGGVTTLLPSASVTDAIVGDDIRVFGPSEGVDEKQLDQIGAIYRAVGDGRG